MKDPAFLFYSQDFITGTLAMPFDERGKYITLLCYQHQSGRMSEETIRFIVGSISDNLRLKFKCDENGLLYNQRLEIEIEKRNKFIESRVNNGKLGGRPKETKKASGKPLGLANANLIENENENEIKKEDIISLFNNICKSLPKIERLTESRKSKLKKRIIELKTIEEWEMLFNIVEKSDFLTGKYDKWRANFDWLIENDKNYLKVLEGNYNNTLEAKITPQKPINNDSFKR